MNSTFQKIIHIDMDCFYAAIEIRDNPELMNKPVAVGGPPDKRGVICTCNYQARRSGIHSAMASATALRHCKDLILLPVNMPKYRQTAQLIQQIFRDYTDLVEPLSLDEAYLDVSESSIHQGSATLIAREIRQRIFDTQQLTASAGVAPNKFLAKIASGWKKPNGLFVIRPHEIENFVKVLPVDELYGVGKVNAEKLHKKNIRICADLQNFSLLELTQQFGKLGQHLYEQCRGIDHRKVQPNKIRKSLSVERTFPEDVTNLQRCIDIIRELYEKLKLRIEESAAGQPIKNQYIKIKFNDFKQTTAESVTHEINLQQFIVLFHDAYSQEKRSIRLLGVGVHFNNQSQQSLF